MRKSRSRFYPKNCSTAFLSTCLRRLALTAGLLCFIAPIHAEIIPYGGTVAPFKTAPVVDGKLAPDEWAGAVQTTGFAAAPNQGNLLARGGTTRFGFQGDRLYIAVVSEYPPTGKMHASGTNRDKDYVYDESIEIWLDPNRANRESGLGDQRFYQMNSNAEGGIYDISFDAKTGPDTGWNGNWEYANHVDHDTHTWTAEISIPFVDLGWEPGTVVGRTLGVLISRNFKAPWEQSTWFPVLGAFVDWSRYAAISLTSDAPSVAIESLGENLHSPHLQLRAKITNPGPARKATVKLDLLSSDMPAVSDKKEIDLPAGATVEYAFNDSAERLHADAKHTLTFDVTSADSATPLMHYGATWTQAPEKKWFYHVGPNPAAALAFAYYPSYQFVRVQMDPRELTEALGESCKKAQVVITDAAGKSVVDEPLTWEKAPGLHEFPVGDLADGVYTLTVTPDGWDEPLVRTFTRKHFPFEGNKLGITDDVLAPFKPIVVKDDTVSVVYRDYTVDGLGFWRSAKAAGNVSAGGPKELLAGPMALVANGKPLTGKGAFSKKTANAVVYEGEAENDAVAITTKCTTEYDGCMKVELTLKPGTQKAELETLTFDIPLKDELMPLWHVSTTGLRVNPAGATPTGEGAIWNSTMFPDGNWSSSFKCYMWLGAEERGFCWFADNDAGWVLATDAKGQPNKATQELIRKDGVLTMRINLVQTPITLTEPRTIVFGVMASPAKPMAEDWRQRDVTIPSRFNMGYATFATFCAKAPWGNDFTIADWCYNRRLGKPNPTPEEKAAWIARNFPEDMEPKFREGVINLAYNVFFNNFRSDLSYMKMYFDEFHTTSAAHPESHVFQSEWSGQWHRQLIDHPTVKAHKSAGVSVSGIVDSHVDFACWYAAEWIKRGIGCYFDNSFPMRGFDLLTTTAYRMPNGQIQPSAGMWARREYLKRIWVLHRLLGPKDARVAMMIHMTNTHIIPYMVWNDENLDLEWKDAVDPAQSKYGHQFLRAESLGRQSGNVPYAIAHLVGKATPEQRAEAMRTRFGALMVHEIRTGWAGYQYKPLFDVLKAFGYSEADCKTFNYWDAPAPVVASDSECKWLLLERNGELLLLLCTWNAEASTVSLKLDTAVLGLTPTQAVNAENPADAYAFDGKTLTVKLPRYGVALINLK